MPRVDATFPTLRRLHAHDNEAALAEVFGAQWEDVRPRWEAGVGTLLAPRWDDTLGEVVTERNRSTATVIGERVAGAFGGDFDPDLMDEWLAASGRIAGENINTATRDSLAELEDLDELDEFFGETLIGVRAGLYAVEMVTRSANFGAQDGARAGGAEFKMWKTNSGRPRESHSALDGEVVRLSENFSNGMAWPGDPSGGAEELANCACSLEFL